MERGENQGGRLSLHGGLSNDYLNRFAEAIMVIELMDRDLVAQMTPWRAVSYSEHFLASRFTDAPRALAAYADLPQSQRERLDFLAERLERLLTTTFLALERVSQEGWASISRRASPLLRREFDILSQYINGSREDAWLPPPLDEAINLILAD